MRVPKYVLPILVLVFLSGGYFLRTGFTQPTTQVTFGQSGQEKVECVVEGLKCKGTAFFFTKLYEETPGIASIETFGSEHLAVFTFDPNIITRDEIRAIMEAPVPLRDGRRVQVFQCVEMK
jgi:hypothetical protein